MNFKIRPKSCKALQLHLNFSGDLLISSLFSFQSKTLVKKLFSVLNSVARSLLRKKVSFEDATEISTPSLTINLKSATPSNVGGKLNVGFANFNVPRGNDMFRKTKSGLTSVNQKVGSGGKIITSLKRSESVSLSVKYGWHHAVYTGILARPNNVRHCH